MSSHLSYKGLLINTYHILSLSFEKVKTKLNGIKFQQMSLADSKLSQEAQLFKKFIFNPFLLIVQDLEIVLTNSQYQSQLAQINFFVTCLLDWLTSILKKNSHLGILVGMALLEKNKSGVQMLHQCDDMDYKSRVKNNNLECNCQLISLVIRYSSLFSPKLQLKLYSMLLDNQIFIVDDHISQLTKAIVENIFYLGSQLTIDNILFISDVQSIQFLALLGFSNPLIRQKMDINLYNIFNYIERLMNSNNQKFWSKSLKSIISLYTYPFLLFSDELSLKSYLLDDSKMQQTIMHLVGQLLQLETYDTYDVSTLGYDSNYMMQWMSQNMDGMLASEIISLCQYTLLKELIIKTKEHHSFKTLLFENFVQCLRIAQNKRIEEQYRKTKMFEVNVSLTKFVGYIIVAYLPSSPKKKSIKEILYHLPFQNKAEIKNIFTNIIRILFDLPSMNLHFLKYIQPQCENIAPEANMSFHAYYNNVLNAQTISYDLFMFTLQLGFLIGNCDILMLEMKQRLLHDIEELDTYSDFLLRDILLLLDVMENPYYFYNVQSFLTGNHQKKLVQNTLISILQLNGELQHDFLIETIKSFIHVKDVPNEWIQEVLDYKSKKKTYTLKKQFRNKFPCVCLQKDIDSVSLLIDKADGDFLFECLDNDHEYLETIRNRVFLNKCFLNLFEECLLSKPSARQLFLPWVAKYVYYGKKVLEQCKEKKMSQDRYEGLEKVLGSQYAKEFRGEVIKNRKIVKCTEFLQEFKKL